MLQSVGIQIREQRRKKKITQTELAEMVGLATITIRQYESGKREPRLRELQKIAAALDVSINTLLGGPKTFDTWADFDAAREKILETACGDQVTILHAVDPKKTVSRLMDLLNDRGQAAAVDRIQELTEIQRYRRTTTETAFAPPAGEDTTKSNDPDRGSNSPPAGSP